MNSAMGPIFNEKVDKKWSLWVRKQCTSVLFTVEKSTKPALKEKKKKNLKTRKVENVNMDVLSKLHLSVRLVKIIFASLFLLLFLGIIVFFGTIHESHYIILTNFYLYLQYFQQKVFSFSKISGHQSDLGFCFSLFLSKLGFRVSKWGFDLGRPISLQVKRCGHGLIHIKFHLFNIKIDVTSLKSE